MKTKPFALLLIFSLFFSLSSTSFAKSPTPEDILKDKYPIEIVNIVKTDDLNYDKKKESFILTESGNFFLINSKGYIVLIDTGIYKDYFDELNFELVQVSKKEKHIAIIGTYLPSNTQAFVYRLKDGTLTKVLDVMGDVDVKIDKKGRVIQHWKKHRGADVGGWDLAEGIYTWNVKTNKYKGSGDYSHKYKS